MKRILIPMDFTEVSNNALTYALQMFDMERIYITHSTFGSYHLDSKDEEPRVNKKQILTTELTEEVLKIMRQDKLPENISIHILKGDILPSTKKFVEENNISAVVMGTRDKYTLFDKWIGTTSLSIVKTLKIPVYLIPPFSKFREFKNVLVASDFHLGNKQLVDELKNWNMSYGAFIRFLHIQDENKKDFELEKNTIVDSFYENEEPHFGFEIISKKSKDISQSLLASAYNYNSDIIIAAPDNQNFINSLLFRSVTKDLILKSEIPLLFLHSEKIIS